jgi:hypothetical protein
MKSKSLHRISSYISESTRVPAGNIHTACLKDGIDTSMIKARLREINKG